MDKLWHVVFASSLQSAKVMVIRKISEAPSIFQQSCDKVGSEDYLVSAPDKETAKIIAVNGHNGELTVSYVEADHQAGYCFLKATA
jgi:hypothetical protein